MRFYCLAVLLASTSLGISAPVEAQSKTQVGATTANPSLSAFQRGVRSDERRRELLARRFEMAVSVRGGLAETTLEVSFAGLNDDGLEGNFHVDLPPGSIVTGYALDIGGRMVEGSLVDAPKARAAYERNVRQRVDPGLGEVDAQGGFNSRVFPVNAKEGRRIRLRFVTPVGDGFRMPLNMAAPSEQWSIRVDTAGMTNPPKINFEGTRVPGSATGSWAASGKDAINGALVIAPPALADAIASRHPVGETYWQLSGDDPIKKLSERRNLRIYWDRSRSRRDDDHAGALKRVREAVATLAPARIEWVAFNALGAERAMLLNADAVAAKVAEVRYAGSTSLKPLMRDQPTDDCLLVSDGKPTLDFAQAFPVECRLFTIASSPGADRARLSNWASENGGRLVETGSDRIDWRAPAVEAVTDSTGKRLEFVSLPAPAGQWLVATRAPANGAVRVRIGGMTVERQSQGGASFSGEGAFLARRRLVALDDTATRPEFVAESRRYSIASPDLSFVVLETPEDYVRNDIEPLGDYPERAKWQELRAEADEQEASEKTERFAVVLDHWQDEVVWWERSFAPKKRPRPRGQVRTSRNTNADDERTAPSGDSGTAAANIRCR